MGRPRVSEEHKRKTNAERMRKWRKANPDKVKEIQLRYWAKRIAKLQQAGDEA